MTGKETYDTEASARRALRRIQSLASSKRRRIPQRVYRCDHGPHWHLTHEAIERAPNLARRKRRR